MSLVERDHEFALLKTAFTECLPAQGRMVMINGPVACGKTALLRAFVEHASARSAHTLSATCSRSERSIPLGVIAQLASHPGVPVDWPPLVPPPCADTAAAPSGTEPRLDSVDAVTAGIMHGICTALLELAEQAPTVITVDDIEYADTPSLQFLLYLARRLYTARIVLVLTSCDRMHTTDQVFHTELLRQPHCRSLRLNRLSRDGTARILAERLGHPAAERVASDAHQMTGGNPLLVHALAEDQHLCAGGDSQHTDGRQATTIWSTFDRAVLSCLHRGGPEALSLAGAMAVLGESAAIVAPHRLLDVEPVSAALTLHRLTTAGLVDDGLLRHPAVRSAVRKALSPRDSAVLHATAAELLHDAGAPPGIVARHLFHSTLDRPWTVDVLEDAAAAALSDDDPDLAAAFLDRAYDICADERRRAGIRADLVAVRWRVDPSQAARHYPVIADAIRAGHLSGRRAAEMIKYMLWDGRHDDAADSLRVLDETLDERDTAAHEELRILRLWSASSHTPLQRHTQPESAERSGAATPITITASPLLQGAAILAEALTTGPDTTTLVSAERILQRAHLSEKTFDALESAMLALLALLHADQPETAAQWCGRLLDEEAVRHAPTWQAILTGTRAGLAVRQGDLALAYDHARTAFHHLSPRSWGVAIGFPLATLVLSATVLGRFDEASRHLDQAVPRSMFRTRYALHYLHARGHYHLETRRHHAALADFLSCGELMREWDLDLPALVPWRSSAAEAWLRLGNQDQARRLVEEQTARPGGNQPRTRGISLRVLAAAGDITHRVALLKEAVELLDSCGARLELARALGDLSHAYQAVGEHRRARLKLHRAIGVAEECGALPLRDTLLLNADLPVALGDTAEMGRPSLDGMLATLTTAERRVAALASRGHTNREIANRLFVTISTVEQHLTKVYRKLKVRHRGDLPPGLDLDLDFDFAEST